MKKIRKIVVGTIVLLLVVHVYISFAEKMLVVNWQAETSDDSAGFMIYNNGTELIADVKDPTARTYAGAITVMLGGVDTRVLVEGPNIITVRQYDQAGNVSADSLPATAIIVDTIAPPVPTSVTATIEDI